MAEFVFCMLNVKFALLAKALSGPGSAPFFYGAAITGFHTVLLVVWTARLLHVCVNTRQIVGAEELMQASYSAGVT